MNKTDKKPDEYYRWTVLDKHLYEVLLSFDDALTKTALRVGIALCDHYNVRTNRCDPSAQSLAQRLGVSRRAVQEGKLALEDQGWIMVDLNAGSDGANKYFLNFALARKFDEAQRAGKVAKALFLANFVPPGGRRIFPRTPAEMRAGEMNGGAPKTFSNTEGNLIRGDDHEVPLSTARPERTIEAEIRSVVDATDGRLQKFERHHRDYVPDLVDTVQRGEISVEVAKTTLLDVLEEIIT